MISKSNSLSLPHFLSDTSDQSFIRLDIKIWLSLMQKLIFCDFSVKSSNILTASQFTKLSEYLTFLIPF